MKNYKYRVFEIIQIGKDHDMPSITFDFFIAGVIVVNLFVTLFETFDASIPYTGLLNVIDFITMLIFAVEYGLRVWTAEYLYPQKRVVAAKFSYIKSFYGLIDLFSFLPYFLPIFFPMGVVAFRMLRVARIFRLFRINTYYDAFNVITDVLNDKKDQIFSSVCIILILMVASSLCMYSLEHEVQPDKFQNAFSGIWWAVSTLLTVGYGDIYPITDVGRVIGILIAFLGVGTVAIPTGIISAGFVEHYTKMKTVTEYSDGADLRFISLLIDEGHPWENLHVNEIYFPKGLILAVISRGGEVVVPRGNTVLCAGDKLVVGAEGFRDEIGIKLRELVLRDKHPWAGTAIKNLDISRQTLIVMVRRGDKVLIPNGSLVLEVGDMVVLYTKKDIRDSVEIKI